MPCVRGYIYSLLWVSKNLHLKNELNVKFISLKLFTFADLATSGNVETSLNNMKHNGRSNVNRTTGSRILAETIVAVEKLHALNINHGDLAPRNMVVDAEGHLLLADFGYSTELNGDDDSRFNWRDLAEICDINFFRIRFDSLISLSKMLKNATDAQVHG